MKNNLFFIAGLIIFATLIWLFTSICMNYSYKSAESDISVCEECEESSFTKFLYENEDK